MLTYKAIVRRADKLIRDDWTKDYVREFACAIRSYPVIATVLTPRAFLAAVNEIINAQATGGKGSIIAQSWGAYPLFAKIGSQKRSAVILEDSLSRVQRIAKVLGRTKSYRETVHRLAKPDPTCWMPALVEITVFGAMDKTGYKFRPYEAVGGRNHDLVLLSPSREVHLDCLCITRTMVDRWR